MIQEMMVFVHGRHIVMYAAPASSSSGTGNLGCYQAKVSAHPSVAAHPTKTTISLPLGFIHNDDVFAFLKDTDSSLHNLKVV
jgi:hypothetical protein